MFRPLFASPLVTRSYALLDGLISPTYLWFGPGPKGSMVGRIGRSNFLLPTTIHEICLSWRSSSFEGYTIYPTVSDFSIPIETGRPH